MSKSHRFVEADLKLMQERIASKNRIQLPASSKSTVPVKKIKVVKPSAGKDFIEFVLKSHNIEFTKEYVFSPTRKFRFDFSFFHKIAFGQLKVAIEYEGIFSGKSRHTSLSGYITDCEKYNLAALDGWVVLRYTGNGYKKFADDIKKIIS